MVAHTELTMPDGRILKHAAHQCQPGTRWPYGGLEWPAILRLLNRRDLGWRN